MSYRVVFAPSAAREFRKLPKRIQALLSPRIDALALEPRPEGSKKLAGPYDLWRLREGDYRLLYQIRDAVLCVLVARAGHRGDVYRQLDRMAKSLRE